MLWYFIFGIVFAIVLFPLLDAIIVLIATWIEVLKGRLSVKLAKYQKEIDDLDIGEKEEKTPAIGFVYPDVEEYYEEDEEDYE